MKRLALILLLAGCDAPPDVGSPIPTNGPAPQLAPLDQLNAQAGAPRSGPETAASLDARGAALRARAAALR